MGGAVPLFPLYAFRVWKVTTLPLPWEFRRQTTSTADCSSN